MECTMKGDLNPVREFKRLAEQALPGWDVAVFMKGVVSASEASTVRTKVPISSSITAGTSIP
jgi:hypothetical protein